MNRRGVPLLAGTAVVFSAAGLAVGYWLGRDSATGPSIPGGAGSPSGAATAPSAEEVKWAEEVADKYLQAASQKGFYSGAASAWTSQAFKDRLGTSDPSDYWFTDWRIEEERPSPERDEVVFGGRLKATWATSRSGGGANPLVSPLDLPFTVLVGRDRQTGQWRVEWAEFVGEKPKKE
jgi:hypothetical protein